MVDAHNEFLGVMSEVDVLRALGAGKDLSLLTAVDLMVHDRIVVTTETTHEPDVKLMEEKRWLTLPVTQHGWEADSVT
jgi:CBS-domain-containing membrane protein